MTEGEANEEADDAEAPDVEDPGDAEPASPEDADGPDLSDDDYVDVDPDLAEQVAAAENGADEDASADGIDESDDAEDDDSGDAPPDGQVSVGDLYCNSLGMAATLARERAGSGVSDRERQMDEYADLARQIDLDTYVDQWYQEHGGADELTPGQAILVGTSMFAMTVLMEDPDLATNAMDGLAEVRP